MKRTLVFILVLLAALNAPADVPRPEKPNIILLLTDDLGWQDVKCYDVDAPSPLETPNIDKLATKGVKFWQAYSPAPNCAPTRVAIITGMHPARTGLTDVLCGQPPVPYTPEWGIIWPWVAGGITEEQAKEALPAVLKRNGYVTGHSGKWHMGRAWGPQVSPDLGFDQAGSSRGVQVPMKPDRLTGFATTDPNDPFRLDENGFPFDDPQDKAMTFVKENKAKPFFLYYATWLVHGPWVMRSEQLLNKYVEKLGVELTEEAKRGWKGGGQSDPFYAAMVEQLDYYCGQLFDYLETTDDPRWPGHKLIENTYIIFSSDNGGAHPAADNTPLTGGKQAVTEGGIRVPLIITGPGIPAGVETDVMAQGLDFFPTILSLAGIEKPEGKILDGADLSKLLHQDPTDPSLIKEADGRVRDTLFWHFPHSASISSMIREGDYKLIRRYGETNTLKLFRLYNSAGGKTVRRDIEEKNDLAEVMPEKVKELNDRLTAKLTAMNASYPYKNPHQGMQGSDKIPTVLSHAIKGYNLEFTYRENGTRLVRADLLYTLDGEEWNRKEAVIEGNARITASLPKGVTHYVLNLVDKNNFLVSYPEMDDHQTLQQNKSKHRHKAIKLDLIKTVVDSLSAGEKLYLTTKLADKIVNSVGVVADNRAWEGKNPIRVGGQTYERGLGAHAESEITYQLNGKFQNFHVVPGPDDQGTGVVEMKILVDGKEVHTTGKVSSQGYQAKALDIPVAGAKSLTLVVGNADGNRSSDHASWADACLVKGEEVKRDVVYKSVGGEDVLLDIYYPGNKTSERLPVFYYLHPGGWYVGDKGNIRKDLFEKLLARGVACVSANYRLVKREPDYPVIMRECAADVKDGLRFLKKNEEKFGLDLSRVVTAGSSAGAHLALLSALSGPGDFSGDPGLKDVPVRPAGCLSFSGPVDFTDSDLFVPAGFKGNLNPNRFTDRIKKGVQRISYEKADDDLKAMMREVSPVYYLQQGRPPVLMIHGDRDGTIPLKHAQRLREKAEAVGMSVQVIEVKGAGHSFGGDHTPSPESLTRSSVDFVLEHLGVE